MHPVALAPLMLLLLSAPIDIASAQLPATVAPPYTLMDDETRTFIQGGVETPLKGNGPLTGYAYLFSTRPHFLAEDLYLRLVVPPGYLISELIFDRWPSEHSALGVGVSGGFFAESQTEFQEMSMETVLIVLGEQRRLTPFTAVASGFRGLRRVASWRGAPEVAYESVALPLSYPGVRLILHQLRGAPVASIE